ncbi:MAG: hypothetical protein RBR23_03550 [Arcobacteraceae bacterium]|jgi:hypothetical protein|nr:hypothetical protein [Arcobacteraceae bacterium]
MNVSAHGVVFNSYNIDKQTNVTKQQKENQSFQELVGKSTKEDYVYLSQKDIHTSVQTIFIDPVSQKLAMVSLKDETIAKIRDFFGEKDVVSNPNGTVSLANKAQNFVSSWFADIAYNRGFIQADKDNNGLLDKDEYQNTYNDVAVELLHPEILEDGTMKLLAASAKVVSNYIQSNGQIYERTSFNPTTGTFEGTGEISQENYIVYRNGETIDSLDDELNFTLLSDSDFNGELTLQEAFSINNDGNIEEIMAKHLRNFGISTIPSDIKLEDVSFDSLLQFMIELITKALKQAQSGEVADFGEIMTKEKLENIAIFKEVGKI